MFADYSPRRQDDARLTLPQGLLVRQAMPQDVPAIAQLSSDRHGLPFDACLQSAERQFEADTAEENVTAVAAVGAEVTGFGRARRVDSKPGVPAGWYLLGVIVAPAMRRCGIATELTRYRVEWLRGHTSEVFYFANSLNQASIDLHRKLGFAEVCRPFAFPGATFSGGGVGVLFSRSLR